ncbi:MAG: type II toxin-antitoxin system RelE/ParE family toxin [Gammaproteobacteria bacterium]|jgi:mRNA interferase RelE/StbE|nr:type II toxin-antitoxin system RelE/ParE family toxin [Gammaproteobacteria bacterium]MBK6581519.1 type II toxin-antitoxin system RelE/ParE family toxin [Gammaproteobacteria bacterium]MBK7522281.1 type II toxin-antitoxin system RelE/ParE family toxin [Gammaproteobacteria bacterium]MBK8307823.1 type II toxin-antitoxin system RelE/ParE family toxin [Gammaproteobacteria bacterium]MBK9664212.1 type II toxin-antitoxin system RelE/ParE family toxin [Gammaproteobacteria bacterium]
MTYELAFKTSALKEWKKLGHTVQEQFKKKLAERLKNPHVPSAALSGATNIYKIKLRQAGYRLVYSVEDKTITVIVIAVGKRDRNEVYDVALSRLQDPQAP